MTGAGFEPATPKRLQLKCSALDHSAIQPGQVTVFKKKIFYYFFFAVYNFKVIKFLI